MRPGSQAVADAPGVFLLWYAGTSSDDDEHGTEEVYASKPDADARARRLNEEWAGQSQWRTFSPDWPYTVKEVPLR